MQKIRIFVVSLTILVLAATSLEGISAAAQVAWVNESKGRVHINGGENDGYVLGAVVCFFVSGGKNLACGIVQSTSAAKAVVKVEKRWAKRITKGTEAILYVEKERKEDTEEKGEKEDKEEMNEKKD
jgi:UPF0716 family protein affecting phage T7 exclusion